MSDADKVRAAADYIERVGLYKGYYFDTVAHPGLWVHEAVEQNIPCCTLGALIAQDVDWSVEHMIHELVGGSIGPWNDAPERTKEEVVQTLRTFADSLDAAA